MVQPLLMAGDCDPTSLLCQLLDTKVSSQQLQCAVLRNVHEMLIYYTLVCVLHKCPQTQMKEYVFRFKGLTVTIDSS